MIERYGSANGFGWNLNEVLGVQLVSVPMALPLQRADHAWQVVMALLAAVFVLIVAALNGMLWWLVIRPVEQLARLADRVSLGDMTVPEIRFAGGDEIGALAAAFTRMRKSLVHAIKMLDP